MVNTAFRLTLVLLFIVAVVHGRSSSRQDQHWREDQSYVDKTRDRLRSDVNETQDRDDDRRDLDDDRRDQFDDRRDQDDDRRYQRYQRIGKVPKVPERYQRTQDNDQSVQDDDRRDQDVDRGDQDDDKRDQGDDRRDQDDDRRDQDDDRRDQGDDRRDQDDDRRDQDDDRRDQDDDRRDQDDDRRYQRYHRKGKVPNVPERYQRTQDDDQSVQDDDRRDQDVDRGDQDDDRRDQGDDRRDQDDDRRDQDNDRRDQGDDRRDQDDDRRDQGDDRRDQNDDRRDQDDDRRDQDDDRRDQDDDRRDQDDDRRDQDDDRRDQDDYRRDQDDDRRYQRYQRIGKVPKVPERYQRMQDDDQSVQDDDRRDQDDRRKRHQRMKFDEKKHRKEEEKRKDRHLRCRKDDYQRDRNQDCREHQDDYQRNRYQDRRERQDVYRRERYHDRREYRNNVYKESKENDETLGAGQCDPKVIDKTRLRQDPSNQSDSRLQLIEIINKYHLRNKNDENKTFWERSQGQNQQQVGTIKDDVAKRRRLYRERREREHNLRQTIKQQQDCLQRLEEIGTGDDHVEKHRLRYQDEDRRQINRDRSDYDVDFRNRYNYRGLSPGKILLLGISKPPSDLRGLNKNEIQLKDQVIVYDDGKPQRRVYDNDRFDVDPKYQDETDLRDQVIIVNGEYQTKKPPVKDRRQRRDVEDQTKIPSLRYRDQERRQNQQDRLKDEYPYIFRNNDDVREQYRQLVDPKREKNYYNHYSQSYGNRNSYLNSLFKNLNPLYNNREYNYYNGATNQQSSNEDETRYLMPVQVPSVNNYRVYPSYQDDDVAALQGNNFIENLQLNDLALEKLLNVVQNVTRGNIKAFYELEILNILDELTADGLCRKNDIYWRYDLMIQLAISETWLSPLKTAVKIFRRIIHVQAAIQDIRDIIEDTQEKCYGIATQCNEIIAERILESPDRDLLVYEAKNLELMAQAARMFLDLKPEFEKAVLFKNVSTYFSKSKKQIKLFIDKLVKARAHASIDTLDC